MKWISRAIGLEVFDGLFFAERASNRAMWAVDRATRREDRATRGVNRAMSEPIKHYGGHSHLPTRAIKLSTRAIICFTRAIIL